MKLDEAIRHAEEVAEKNEKTAKIIENNFAQLRREQRQEVNSCRECASEHRQLAEWLRELKKWRALRDSINMLCDVDCEYPQYRESGTMCDACPIGTVKEYFEQIFDEEVKADADSD